MTLWSKNYIIITIGTIISAIGGVGINFAIGVLVYNQTQSTLLTALFSAVVMIPNIIFPLFIGPNIDRFSRKNIIVRSDMLMGILFLVIAFVTKDGYFNYSMYMILGFVLSTNGVIYGIAYESLFPELIPEKMMQQGYAISSLIYPLVNTIMLPIAAIVFQNYGPSAIFLIEGVLLLIASFFERFIKIDEAQIKRFKEAPQKLRVMIKDGLDYLKNERGLIAIFSFFFFFMMAGEGLNTLLYPFFESHPTLTITQFAYLSSFITAGRLIGGIWHYVFKVKTQHRFMVAAFVYFSLNVLNGILLLVPYPFMLALQVIMGVLSINSFNIRMSSVQTYVPSEKRGRVNGVYHLLVSSGMIIGRLIAGTLGEFFPYQWIVMGFSSIGILAFFFIIVVQAPHVRAIYNRKV
jgi:MFS transporter, DHA3 family, macrolide efflux protein